jgi:hypothetical protein
MWGTIKREDGKGVVEAHASRDDASSDWTFSMAWDFHL